MFALPRLGVSRKSLPATEFERRPACRSCRYPKELRRMKTVDDAAELERFAAHHRQSVLDEVLAPAREDKGNPHWRPTGFMEGLAYQARISKILRERFIAQ